MFIRIRHRALWSGLLVLALLAAMLPGMDSAQAQDSDPVTPTSGEPLTTPTTEADAPVDETSQDTPPADTPEATAEPTSEPTPEPEEEAGDTPTPEPLEAITPEPEFDQAALQEDLLVEDEISAEGIKDRYIVVLKDQYKGSAANQAVRQDAATRGGRVRYVYEGALNGFSAYLPPAALNALQKNPAVDYIEPVQLMQLVQDEIGTAGTQDNPPNWGLDRIDQRALPLNNVYNYDYTGSGVHVYVIDSGILTTHNDFGGRAIWEVDYVNEGTTDCNGHGTHVAGIIGGATYGVAKGVSLHSVRVFGCGETTSSEIVINGINWVYNNRQLPAVANLSLAAPGDITTVNNALENLINDKKVFAAVAAGNKNDNACNYSPARVPEAFTVGNSQSNDYRNGYSNYGACLDLFAPGTSILSTFIPENNSTATKSGTSMSAPHAAGVAALYLQANLSASPATVSSVLIDRSTKDKISDPGSGSPNRLLYTIDNLLDSTTIINADSPDPSLHKQLVSNSVTVSGSGTTPTGTVLVSSESNNCTVTLSGGTGSCDLTWTTAGVKTITATYSGDSVYAASQDTETHTVEWDLQEKTFLSGAVADGWVLESTRTSSKGGSLNRTATTLRVGDDAKKRQYRSILHFGTGGLPDNAVITSVQLRIRRAAVIGANPFNSLGNIVVDTRRGPYSGANKLQLTDWQASTTPGILAAGRITNNPDGMGWYTLDLGGASINKKGVSQMRLRFGRQNNANWRADYITFYSGNAAIPNRPRVIVTYYLP